MAAIITSDIVNNNDANAEGTQLKPVFVAPEVPPSFIAYDDLLDVKNNVPYLEKLIQEARNMQSMQKSYWRSSDDVSPPTCTLEAIASELFKFHTNGKDYVMIDGNDVDKYEGKILIDNNKKKKKKKKKKKSSALNIGNVKKLKIDHTKSGVEWWVQVRGPEESKGTSLGFHWDENYENDDDDNNNKNKSSLVTRRNKLPWLSTVSYLCDKGAPTVAVPLSPFEVEDRFPKSLAKKNRNDTEDIDDDLQIKEGYVSFPKIGKHMAFKGHYLHGVPAELVNDNGDPLDGFHPGKNSNDKKKYVRVTFLVNIWINTGPPNSVMPNTEITPLVNKHVNNNLTSFLKEFHTVKRDPISEIITDEGTQVCGFGFGKSADESYQFWLPAPLEAFYKGKAKKKQPRTSFKLIFNGGEDAPCFLCRA